MIWKLRENLRKILATSGGFQNSGPLYEALITRTPAQRTATLWKHQLPLPSWASGVTLELGNRGLAQDQKGSRYHEDLSVIEQMGLLLPGAAAWHLLVGGPCPVAGRNNYRQLWSHVPSMAIVSYASSMRQYHTFNYQNHDFCRLPTISI